MGITPASNGAAAGSAPGPYRVLVATLLLAAGAANGVNFMAASPLLPVFMADFGIESAQAGLLFSVVPLFATVSTIPASLLSARLGLRVTYGLGLVLMAGGLLVLLFPSFWGVLGGRALLGMGGGVLPLGTAITVQWFRSRTLPLINSAAFVCLSLGFTAGLGATVPLAQAAGWQTPLALYASLAAIVAALWMLLARDGPYGRGEPTATAEVTPRRNVYLQRRTWLLAIGFAGPIACYDTFTAWLPTYYSTVGGMDLGQASTLVGVLGLAGVPGALLGGWLTSRSGVRRPFIILPGVLLPPTALASFLLTDPTLLVGVLVLFGLLAWGFNPAYVTIPMELPGISAVDVGAVLSVVFTLTGLCVFVLPLVVGALVDATGSFVPGFMLCVATSSALLAVGVILPETGPGAAPQAGSRSNAAT